MMIYFLAIVVLSVPLLILSWKSLKTKKSHGFYRFFSWECILVLLTFKIEFWFTDPFSIHQVISWILLFISTWFVLAGTITLKKRGKQKEIRNEENLFAFEKTSELVHTGIYRYIRHPLYSSLLLLSLGIYLKKPDLNLLPVIILSILFLYLTALADEKECSNYFGDAYLEYMKKSKRFLPFIF